MEYFKGYFFTLRMNNESWNITWVFFFFFSLYLGSTLIVVVNGYKAIKEILVTKGASFLDRPGMYPNQVQCQNSPFMFIFIMLSILCFSPLHSLIKPFCITVSLNVCLPVSIVLYFLCLMIILTFCIGVRHRGALRVIK